jgi:hypothetical protein
VDLDTLVGKLTVAVLVELTNSGHLDFLDFDFSENWRTFCSSNTSDCWL